MKKHLCFLLFAFCVNYSFLYAQQLSIPNVESVYGGRINAITGYSKNADTSRIFISTESANSVFYTDVANNSSSSASTAFSSFTVMPGLSATANYGSGISNIYAHANSGYLFFAHGNTILSSHPSSSTVNTVSSGGMHSLYITGDYLFYVKQGGPTTFNFGTISSSGAFTPDAGSPITLAIMGMPTISVSHANNKVYIFVAGTFSSAPQLYKSSDDYNALSASTTFSDVSPTTLSSSVEWRAFGIAPDGRIFIGGSDGSTKYSAYTDDEAIWHSASTGVPGVSGTRFAFGGTDTSYYVYFSSAYNSNKGDSSAWVNYGMPGGFETHPNDGDVYVDPNDPNVVYMTTDQGIGASVDRGSSIFEIDNGVEAVQVNDFDMTADKRTAWIASKAGIRKVSNYPGSKSWTPAMFPNGDGSPYYSAEMANDTNTVYVGNSRVYKTTDGSSWTQVFTTESVPYNYNFPSHIEAIEVCQYDPNVVFVGYYAHDANKGGLFYTADGGANWDIIRLDATSGYNDVDVWDIIFTIEGADTVAYVGVEYDLAAPTGRSVYRIVKSGSTWAAAQDMDASNTNTGSLIVATIRDLDKSVSGDTLFACGTDAGTTQPVTYYKVVSSTNKWTPFSASGFPSVTGKQGAAITLGRDTVYCAVENEIYFSTVGGSSWTLGYTYPAGTQINFLYYDELLAGTGTGLYGHLMTESVGLRNISGNKSLLSSYPNPFSNSTLIKYTIQQSGFISMKAFDVRGKEIEVLVNEQRTAGIHEVIFNGSSLPNGMYFIQLNANGQIATIKVMVSK